MKRQDKEHYDGTRDWKNYYWYYYKWHILGSLALILIIAICTAQCMMKVNPDYYVLFYSDTYISDQALAEVTDSLEEISDDLNGDGKVKVQAINCSFTEDDNPNIRLSAHQQATMQMQTTDACIWVLDEQGVDLYYHNQDIDLFAEHSAFNENDKHSINAKKLDSFKLLDKAAKGRIEFQVFLRKDANGKTSEVGKEIIDKLTK